MPAGFDEPGRTASTADRHGQSLIRVWPIVSPPDAKWKAPYSARFHHGASAPGG